MTENSEQYCRAWLEEFTRQDGAHRLETSILVASQVGQSRGGEGWAVEGSTGARVHPRKASEAAFG
jgi:hypothetical protein